jgi:hypothetical protein
VLLPYFEYLSPVNLLNGYFVWKLKFIQRSVKESL